MNTKSKNAIYLYLLLVVFLFLLFPSHFFVLPSQGQASSLAIAVHLAHTFHLGFGKDIDLPYGPLGILETRLPVSVGGWVYLFFDVYFVLTLFFILRRVFSRYLHYGVILFLFLAVTQLGAIGYGDWYLLFVLFYLFSFLSDPSKRSYLVLAAFPAIVGFYCRVDSGFLGILVYTTVITYAWIRKKTGPKQFIVTLSSFCLAVLITGYGLRVNLPGYLSAGWAMLRDCTAARLLFPGTKDGVLYHLSLELLLCLVYWPVCLTLLSVLRHEFRKKSDELFAGVLTGVAVFAYFRMGLARPDDQMIRFFTLAPLLFAFLYLFGPADGWRKVPILCCWIAMGLSVLAVNLQEYPKKTWSGLADLSFLRIRAEGIRDYLSEVRAYHRTKSRLEEDAGRSPTFKTVIGDHTADIIPWDIAKIYSSGLHYDPRPVAQSYLAYNRYLDSLNGAKYLSVSAPDYVLLTLARDSDRFPFFEEARTKLALIDRYAGVTETDGELVLQNVKRHRLVASGEASVRVNLDEDIPIPHLSGLQLTRFLIQYDVKGRLGHFFGQPPGLRIRVTLENEKTFLFKVTKTMLEDGIILNKYVDGKEEFQLLMEANGRYTPDVRMIRIETDRPGGGFIKSMMMKSTYYSFKEKDKAERMADSADIAGLFNRHRPIAWDPLPLVRDSLRYGIEEFDSSSSFVRLKGWAFSERENNDSLGIVPVLQSRDGFYRLPVERQLREDLVRAYNRKDIRQGGFFSAVSKQLLPPGEYQLGLESGKAEEAGKKICYTGRKLLLRSHPKIEASGPVAQVEAGNCAMYHHIDRAVTWTGQVRVDGWAYLDTRDTGKTTTYVILSSKKKTYRVKADVLERQDVAASAGKPSVRYCGFTILIPEDSLVKDEYMVGLEQTCCGGQHRSLQFTGPFVTTGVNDVLIPQQVDSLVPVADFLGTADHFDDQPDYLTISGWAIRVMKEVPYSTIDLVFKSNRAIYICHTVTDKRKDLTERYKNGVNLENGGFQAKVSKQWLAEGRYQIGIWVHPKGGEGAIKFLGLNTVKNYNSP